MLKFSIFWFTWQLWSQKIHWKHADQISHTVNYRQLDQIVDIISCFQQQNSFTKYLYIKYWNGANRSKPNERTECKTMKQNVFPPTFRSSIDSTHCACLWHDFHDANDSTTLETFEPTFSCFCVAAFDFVERESEVESEVKLKMQAKEHFTLPGVLFSFCPLGTLVLLLSVSLASWAFECHPHWMFFRYLVCGRFQQTQTIAFMKKRFYDWWLVGRGNNGWKSYMCSNQQNTKPNAERSLFQRSNYSNFFMNFPFSSAFFVGLLLLSWTNSSVGSKKSFVLGLAAVKS